MKTCIFGAGSLGTVLGAYLSKAGIAVDLFNRNKEHVNALNQNGAHIGGPVDFTVPVHALLPEDMNESYDLIILMTKQLNNPETVPVLASHLTSEGVILTMQNGLPEPFISKIAGKDHTMGCTVEWGATMTGPGECILTSDPGSMSFHTGKPDEISEELFQKIIKLLENMCPVVIEDNFPGVRWSKLLINSAFSGLGTVIGGTFGDVASIPAVRKAAVLCLKECIDVGHAAGIEFVPVQGNDISGLFDFKTPFKRKFVELLIPFAMRKHRAIEPSMLRDIRKGKPCEVFAINGVVCEWGKKYNVPTPYNDWIVKTITEIEQQKRTPSLDNIRSFPKK